MVEQGMDVEVRIREVDEADAVYLTRWPMRELETLIRELKSWGVRPDSLGVTSDIVGQFVIQDGVSFFEVIVGDD